ncbi:MAG: HAD family hydrolase [Roseburia sp.]
MIRYVFFDLGLTLLENSMPERYRKVMAAIGLSISPKRAQEVYHLTNKYFMRERPGEMGKNNRRCFEDYVTYICCLAGDESKTPEVIKQLAAEEKPVWKAFPYTLPVLEELRQKGIKIGLISNWDNTCRNVLKDNGLDSLLDVIVISSEENIEKPDKRIFQKALTLAEIAPEECIYVGDNYYDDAVGAGQLGIRSFIINPPDYLGIEELKEEKITIITDIREIPLKLELM